jgi:hypothetical protein
MKLASIALATAEEELFLCEVQDTWRQEMFLETPGTLQKYPT